MLKKVELEELKMQNNNSGSSYDFQRVSSFKYIEKFDCREVLTTNNLIQVLTGITYHNGIENMPITFYFKEGMNFTDFINMPTVRSLPSIFENIRAFTYDEKFIGFWARTLLEEAKLAYEELYKEDRIDNSLKSIFRIKSNTLSSLSRQPVAAFEIISEEYLDKIEDFINDKLVMYLLSECDKNNGAFGVLLSGWKLAEIESCLYFSKLKKFFDRVFIVGSGEVWSSTHLIVKQPKNELISTMLP